MHLKKCHCPTSGLETDSETSETNGSDSETEIPTLIPSSVFPSGMVGPESKTILHWMDRTKKTDTLMELLLGRYYDSYAPSSVLRSNISTSGANQTRPQVCGCWGPPRRLSPAHRPAPGAQRPNRRQQEIPTKTFSVTQWLWPRQVAHQLQVCITGHLPSLLVEMDFGQTCLPSLGRAALPVQSAFCRDDSRKVVNHVLGSPRSLCWKVYLAE